MGNAPIIHELFTLGTTPYYLLNLAESSEPTSDSSRVLEISWAEATRKVLLVQLSSAASERAFSLLNSSFGHHQNCSSGLY